MKNFLFLLFLFTDSAFSQAPDFIWADKFGGDHDSYSSSITTDISGNVYTTGYLSIIGQPDPYIFILKLNPIGSNIVWLETIAVGNNHSNSITTDFSGNVYITGNFSGVADFDPGLGTYNLTSTGINDIFILKLDSFGNFVWAKNMGGTGDDYGNSIVTDASGNVFTTGFFHGTADFDPGPGVFNLYGDINYNIFISKLDPSGNFVWAKSLGGMFGGVGNSIALDASNNIFTIGYFTGTVDFDPGPSVFNLTSNGSDNLFISKLDSLGNFVFVKAIETIGNIFSTSRLGTNGSLYTMGHFAGTVDFDPGPGIFNLTSFGNGDMFILKLDNSGNFGWVKALGGTGSYTNGKSLAIDVSENIYATGSFYGTTDFDPGAGTFNLNSIGNDIFISKLDSSGNLVWAKPVISSGNEKGTSIAIDAFSGNLCITGVFDDNEINFGSILLHNTNQMLPGNDIFIAELDDATGIENVNNNNNISVTPNPSSKNITIATNKEEGELLLHDFLGKEVMQKTVGHENQTTLDISSLASGIYFLKFTSTKGSYSAKFVKE
jgi:hypothetical protein